MYSISSLLFAFPLNFAPSLVISMSSSKFLPIPRPKKSNKGLIKAGLTRAVNFPGEKPPKALEPVGTSVMGTKAASSTPVHFS